MAYAAMLGVVLAAAIASLILNRDDGSADPAPGAVQETAAVAIAGTSLTPQADGSIGLVDPLQDPSVGAAAPEVSGQSFNGAPLTIGTDGRAKVVVFLAHWCPHCRKEVPLVEGWLNGGGSSPELDWYSVSTSVEASLPNYPPSAWLEREGWSVPVLADSVGGETAAAFGLVSFPYFVAIAADGTVAAQASGELTTSELAALSQAALR